MIRQAACIFLFTAFLYHEAGAVTTCYSCVSSRAGMFNETCAQDTFVGSDSMKETCNTTGHNACVKVITKGYILDPEANTRTQVSVHVERQCGYQKKEKDRRKCIGTTMSETDSRVCYCDTNLCNGGALYLASGWMIIMLVLFAY